MSTSPEELAIKASIHERKLRSLRRHVSEISELDKETLRGDGLANFKARLASAEEYWAEFKAVWDARDHISCRLGESDPFPTDQWNSYYDKLKSDIITARSILISVTDRQDNLNRTSVDQANFSMTASSKPALPKIVIPSFHGDLLKWTSFKDVFLSMVHNQASLSDVEKFHYLIGALKGEAASLISRFPVEEKSYLQAWNKVVETYDNPRVLASLLIHRIVDSDTKKVKGDQQAFDHFLSNVADSIESFRSLNLEDPCEFLLATLALRALDSKTREHFELSLKSSKDLPSADDIIQFVRQRKTALKMSREIVSLSSSDTSSQRRQVSGKGCGFPDRASSSYKAVSLHSAHEPSVMKRSSPNSDQKKSSSNPTGSTHCLYCTREHLIQHCSEFLKLPTPQRSTLIKSLRVCFNCLRKGHRVGDCRSKFRCQHCHRKHHTLIHEELPGAKTSSTKDDNTAAPSDQESKSFTAFGTAHRAPSLTRTVLLGTVRTLIRGSRGDYHSVRALLDSGSEHSFVTTSLASKLGSRISPTNISITGLAESTVPCSVVKGTLQCTIRPYVGDHEFQAQALVIERITSALPRCSLPTPIAEKLSHHQLADYNFGTSKSVDLLIGADIYHLIVTGASHPSEVEGLSLLPTVFGMVVSGSVESHSPSPSLSHSFHTESHFTIEDQLKAFWELEEPSSVDRTSPEDKLCEEHFVATHSRTSEGRYVVRLPFKQNFVHIGNNREAALQRFHSLEHKLRKNSIFSKEYSKFMREYEDLGHMSPVSSEATYLIPHHGVWQSAPCGTAKLRVVFDASCSSSQGSLNDTLLAGPKLQEDICKILIRFRLHAIPLCADIVKMYRQILIHPDDRIFQHVVWRDEPTDALQEFELNTVTYGVKSSAYQALRVMRQLVLDEGSKFPLAAHRILNETYVDDIVSGADTYEEAVQLQRELCELLSKGGFTLGKWASTVSDLIPASSEQVDNISIRPDENTRILGLTWSSRNDTLSYSISSPLPQLITKRTILSSIARIFDPIGLLAPVIFVAKTLLQDIWKERMGWDDVLPGFLQERWKELTTEWTVLSEISVPRYLSLRHADLRLIAFCDASSKGYAACLYLRSTTPQGIKVSLIKAKSKVAPLKYTSIARLELCAAVLSARLISSIPEKLTKKMHCFTDSEVVLAWLRTPVHLLKVFEANRVHQTVSVAPASNWHHVPSNENPADLASRGCSPVTLKEASLWWTGPDWLHRLDFTLPEPVQNHNTLTHFAKKADAEQCPPTDDWCARFSSFSALVRGVARILRLVERFRLGTVTKSGPVTAEEFNEAEIRLIKSVQKTCLPRELLEDHPNAPKTYLQLAPFLDQRGVVRVGGRLANAPLDYSERYPILIPKNSGLSRLIIDHIHSTHYHAGATLTLALLRNKYWIPRATKLIRSYILRCVQCRIGRSQPAAPFMSALPKERFRQFRAFCEVGVDYAGPFLIRESRRRKAVQMKAYLCLFVCMATKALHLEAVSSLTTVDFLAALDRFISRRGSPKTIWSDHGTNFVGASRFLKDVVKFQQEIEPLVTNHLAPQGISWRFIPPRAPHFGGLWEAGVKAVKRLLCGSIGKQACTFEELATAFSKIEGLLNSRPLCPLTEDPEDYNFLTPGHFLIGSPIYSLPEPSDLQHAPPSLLSKWQLVHARVAHVWERWRREYLHTLQQRAKWTKHRCNLKIGDLVILVERRSILGQWPVARVIATYPGRDNVTRVVDVKTPSGQIFKRAVTSVAPLFLHESDSRPDK